MREKEEILKEMTKIERREKALERREKLLEKRKKELLSELREIEQYMIKQLNDYVGKCYEVTDKLSGDKKYLKVICVDKVNIELCVISLVYDEDRNYYLFEVLRGFDPNKNSEDNETKRITLEEFNIHHSNVKKISNNNPTVCSW